MGGTMMRIKTTAFVFTVLLGTATFLHADMNPGDQGLGLYVGSPVGVTYKYWYSHTMAIDGGLGVIGGNFALYATHLWHDFSLIPRPASWNAQSPFYFGLGTRVSFASSPRFGLRSIVGASYMPNAKPLEFFAELGPFLRLTPDIGAEIDGGIGFRYYFKALTNPS
jgi:hypothetical protein